MLVTGRNEQRASDLTAEIEKAGGSAAYHVTALTDVASVRELARWAVAAGDGHVDILVNNAGVAPAGPSDSATEAEFDGTFTVNVKVPFFLVAALAPAMAARVRATISDLPLHQREVVTLRDVQGLRSEEACAILGISQANQRVLQHRGRSKLHQVIESEFGRGQ